MSVHFWLWFFSNPADLLMEKDDLNDYWAKQNISFSFPVPIPNLVLLWASYYTCCNIIRDVNL